MALLDHVQRIAVVITSPDRAVIEPIHLLAKLIHEVWVTVDDGHELHGCCLAGPMGDDFRRLVRAEPGARLVTTFEAGSHFEAMTIYNRLLGREPYETNEDLHFEPYPDEWLAAQRGSDPRTPPT